MPRTDISHLPIPRAEFYAVLAVFLVPSLTIAEPILLLLLNWFSGGKFFPLFAKSPINLWLAIIITDTLTAFAITIIIVFAVYAAHLWRNSKTRHVQNT